MTHSSARRTPTLWSVGARGNYRQFIGPVNPRAAESHDTAPSGLAGDLRRTSAGERAQETVAEGVHLPDRRLRTGVQAVLPAPAGDPVQHLRVLRDDGDRHVV